MRYAALSIVITALCASACTSPPHAPAAAGVCFRANDKGEFIPLESDIPNVDTCGSRLEGVFLQEHQSILGAYGGMFIWVTDESIRAGSMFDGPRAVLITKENRVKIDKLINDGEKAGINTH